MSGTAIFWTLVIIALGTLLVIQDRGGADAVEGIMGGIGLVIMAPVALFILAVWWVFRR